jgi:6-phosphofructokinase
MGRDSGFIAAKATVACANVNIWCDITIINI